MTTVVVIASVAAFLAVLLWESLFVIAKEENTPGTSSNNGETDKDQSLRVKKAISSSGTDEWDDARYAGVFAKVLGNFETRYPKQYTEFISLAYTRDEIPRYLPEPLKVLSRTGRPLPKSRYTFSHAARANLIPHAPSRPILYQFTNFPSKSASIIPAENVNTFHL